jgi:hypothetical protein
VCSARSHRDLHLLAPRIATLLRCDTVTLNLTGAERGGEDVPRTDHTGALQVPLDARGRPLGLLTCRKDEQATWSGRQIRTAHALASVIGLALLDQPPGW